MGRDLPQSRAKPNVVVCSFFSILLHLSISSVIFEFTFVLLWLYLNIAITLRAILNFEKQQSLKIIDVTWAFSKIQYQIYSFFGNCSLLQLAFLFLWPLKTRVCDDCPCFSWLHSRFEWHREGWSRIRPNLGGLSPKPLLSVIETRVFSLCLQGTLCPTCCLHAAFIKNNNAFKSVFQQISLALGNFRYLQKTPVSLCSEHLDGCRTSCWEIIQSWVLAIVAVR